MNSENWCSKIISGWKSLEDKWKNWIVRGFFACIMISGFSFIIAGGPLVLTVFVLAIQVKCFQEILSIGLKVYSVGSSVWFQCLLWYFLIISNYFFHGELLFNFVGVFLNRVELLKFFTKNHQFISFILYYFGFICFELSLVQKHFRLQKIILFIWTHMALLIIVTSSYLIIQNIFEGMIWFIVPVMMVNINDIMAFVFGKFYGKTQLIELSPKKTWEGFIGGGISTLIFGIIFSHVLCKFQFFVCPVEFSKTSSKLVMECQPSNLFQLQKYFIQIGNFETFLTTYPFVLHSLPLSLFCSILGPFGGFFASGFKRAFKIKDFSNFIPGHGGIMDRFDCMFLMAMFVYAYIQSFIYSPSPQKILDLVYELTPEQQIEIYESLKKSLGNRQSL